MTNGPDPFCLAAMEAAFLRGYGDCETEEGRLKSMACTAEHFFFRMCEAYPEKALEWLARRDDAHLRHSGPPAGDQDRVSLPERSFHSRLLVAIGDELSTARAFRDQHGYLPALYDQPELFERVMRHLEGAFPDDQYFPDWVRCLREQAETKRWIEGGAGRDPEDPPTP